MKYRFTDWKDSDDTPMFEVGKLYDGANDDGQLVDIYDGEKLLGTYCVERFEKEENTMKFHVIFNNSTGAPALKISEHDDLALKLVEVEEDQIDEVALEHKCSRAHLYESHDDGVNVIYQYVTTIATTYE